MKKYFILIPILFIFVVANAQHNDMAIADIDMDGVADTVLVDKNEGFIIWKLSRFGFKPQKTQTMESLTSYGFSSWVNLHASLGAFNLSFLGNRASSHFLFVYNKRKKTLYLNEHWSETLGDINGSGANYFTHDIRRGRVNYCIRIYGGPMYAEEYDENAYHTIKFKKRVAKMRISLEEFTVEDYYQKTDYIWEEIKLKTGY